MDRFGCFSFTFFPHRWRVRSDLRFARNTLTPFRSFGRNEPRRQRGRDSCLLCNNRIGAASCGIQQTESTKSRTGGAGLPVTDNSLNSKRRSCAFFHCFAQHAFQRSCHANPLARLFADLRSFAAKNSETVENNREKLSPRFCPHLLALSNPWPRPSLARAWSGATPALFAVRMRKRLKLRITTKRIEIRIEAQEGRRQNTRQL